MHLYQKSRYWVRQLSRIHTDVTYQLELFLITQEFFCWSEGVFPRAYTKLSETELYGSRVGQLHHRLMSHRPKANPHTLIKAYTNCPRTRTGYWQEKSLFPEELLLMSDYCLWTLSQYDILSISRQKK